MKKFLLAILFALCSFTTTMAEEPNTNYRQLTETETTIVTNVNKYSNRFCDASPLTIKFTIDYENVYFASYGKMIDEDGTLYIFGNSKAFHMISIKDSKISIPVSRGRALIIDNAEVVKTIIRDASELPSIFAI